LNELETAINALNEKIATATGEKTTKETAIKRLEKETTSIQPTIDAINDLLSSFGFLGFSLSKAQDAGYYKLIRPDGTEARETLSEGEERFVTFLYFYHLLKGSESESGVTTDRVVVFDDPVSSLDSDIAFVVSSLIRDLFDDVRAGTGYIKQIFVLTHNVYFHREVTFNANRRSKAMNEETFWTIRKPGMESVIENHKDNPIKTSYELLWAEVQRPDRSKLTIRNTLRRILEHYFKILGRIDLDNICNKFAGKEKLICNSLISWAHSGSHYTDDDLYHSIDDSMVETYLTVFKAIFEKSEHLAHYEMMMSNAYAERPEGTETPCIRAAGKP
jgi:wobble nucleotide-excising tRNase